MPPFWQTDPAGDREGSIYRTREEPYHHAAHYVRYDESTATKLLEISKTLLDEYGGLKSLYKRSENRSDLKRRILAFKGVGPMTLRIFLRDMKVVWPKA